MLATSRSSACRRRRVADRFGAGATFKDRLLHLADRLGDADLARARFRAVEDRAAAPHPLAVVQGVQLRRYSSPRHRS